MIKLNLEIDDEKFELELPTGWDEISIKQYDEIVSLKQGGSTLMQFVNILKILTKVDEDTIMAIPASEFQSITDNLTFLQETIEGNEDVESIMIGDEKFFLKKDFEQLTMGESISIELIMKKYDNELSKAIPELLCIFLRKKKENGKLEGFKNSFMERAEMFSDLMISDVHNLFLFFSIGSPTS